MMARVAFFLILSLVALTGSFGQQDCTTAIGNLTACLTENIATCLNCGGFVSPSLGDFNSCTNITASVCPLVNCCSACADAAKDTYQCIIDPITAIIGQCTLDCTSFPFGDANNTINVPCLQEGGALVSCLSNNPQTCEFCTNFTDSFEGFDLNITSTDVCSPLEAIYCNQASCCPSCQTEFTNLIQCTGQYSNCTFPSCAPTTSTPVAPSSSAPIAPTTTAPIAPITPAPVASTTVAPSASATTTAPIAPTPSAPIAPTTSAPSASATTTAPVTSSPVAPSPAPVNGTPSPVANTTAPVPTAPTTVTQPSSSPNAGDRCQSTINALQSCATTNILNCANCVNTAINATSDLSSVRQCSDANSRLCPLASCCPECANQVKAVFACEVANTTSSLSNCVLQCGNSTTTSAAVSTTATFGLPVVFTTIVALVFGLTP